MLPQIISMLLQNTEPSFEFTAKIEPSFRAGATWTGDDTELSGTFENDMFEAEIKKDLGSGFMGTAGYSSDGIWNFGIRKELKKGGLLDRKRS